MKSTSTTKQAGAVSLFVVIFATLIITVITVSFLRIMVNDQRQSSDSDLSQSAYDAAQAGVEDAKRALLRYQRICSETPSSCAALSDSLSTDVCNAAVLVGGVVSSANVSGGSPGKPGEIIVQQSTSSSDKALDQAYTCLKIKLQTEDYLGVLEPNTSQIIPLVSETNPGDATDHLPFDTATVQWFSREDLSNDTGTVALEPMSSSQPLYQQSNWPLDRPPVLRAQLIQFGSSYTMGGFDSVSGSQSNSNTVFLYPTSSAGATNSDLFIARDTRSDNPTDMPDADSAATTPLPVRCESNISAGGYSCKMSLRLPEPIGGGDRTAYLRLSTLYNATEFRLVLSNGVPDLSGSNIVKFKDVQPEVDSTGRANVLFRRVLSRVSLFDTSFPYPDATIDVNGNFCKDFGVAEPSSSDPDGYLEGTCTP
ncbi:MAG: hypothetical protein WAR37_02880 [Candidatus Microsaccharimonas sp.]